MQELRTRLTKDLMAALEKVTGAEPTADNPVVVLAAFIDSLAKDYGLSESLDLDVDPLERTQHLAPEMDIVNHYFADDTEPHADDVRARLYDVFIALADDPKARSRLNQSRSQPFSVDKTLYLAQIYWNLEGTADRPKLRIRPSAGVDIPVPGTGKDFATMRWTDRVNHKGNYKSAGQSFRTQGARLAVLAAQHITEHASPPREAVTAALTLQRTQDPDEPMEITLEESAVRAFLEGEYDDAADLATAYLRIIKRRADASPFDMEPVLAEAYLLRGTTSLRPPPNRGGRIDVGEDAADHLEKAVKSLTTLSELNPENKKHQVGLQDAYFFLSLAYGGSGRVDEAVQEMEHAVSIADGLVANQDVKVEHQKDLVLALQGLGYVLAEAERFEAAAAALRRAVDVAEEVANDQPSDFAHRERLLSLRRALASYLSAAGHCDNAVEESQCAVDFAEQLAADQPENPQRQLDVVASLRCLAIQLNRAQRFGEMVEPTRLADAISTSVVTDYPEPVDKQRIGWNIVASSWMLYQAGLFEAAVVAAHRAIDLFAKLSEAENLLLLAAFHDLLHDSLRANGQFDDAVAAKKRTGEILRQWVATHPEESERQLDFSEPCTDIETFFTDMFANRLRVDRNLLRSTLELAETLRSVLPDYERDAAGKKLFALIAWTLGSEHSSAGQFEEAVAAWHRASLLFAELAEAEPENLEFLGSSYAALSASLWLDAQRADAMVAMNRAIRTFEQWVAAQPEDTEGQLRLSLSLDDRADMLAHSQRFEEAAESARRAVTIRESVATDHPGAIAIQHRAIDIRNLLGDDGTRWLGANFRQNLAIDMVRLVRFHRLAGQLAEAVAAAHSAARNFRALEAPDSWIKSELFELQRECRALGEYDLANTVDQLSPEL